MEVSTVPRTRGRPKLAPDAERRDEIVATAMQMFRQSGYAQLTTDAVAARCHISKRTLYKLFPSKAALITAIIDQHRQLMLRLPANYDDVPLDQALDLIFGNEIDDEADRERFAFLQLLFVEAIRHPELEEISEPHGKGVVLQLLADWIAHECARGRLNVPDPQDAARMLMDMVAGSITPSRDGRIAWVGSERRRAYVRECIRLFLSGAQVAR
ncbi:TetR/AcrR family transcriptional regulator [Ancylobacter pratisalsi]|uniref:TetR/AcrR family transcriptional regulator n=2 Tax=Ancylobacter pratisalsi TaxID=1745854 RepID=A0A6P1YUD1_9HYPH|nr:TetR/AcrR family transcriptional regulator [Ancylobacter pratisalsi]